MASLASNMPVPIMAARAALQTDIQMISYQGLLILFIRKWSNSFSAYRSTSLSIRVADLVIWCITYPLNIRGIHWLFSLLT